MASQVQIPFEGVILQEHSAPISCPTPNFAKGSKVNRFLSKSYTSTPSACSTNRLPFHRVRCKTMAIPSTTSLQVPPQGKRAAVMHGQCSRPAEGRRPHAPQAGKSGWRSLQAS